jgi:hypothetical protein
MQEQGPCIFGVLGGTDCGGTVSDDSSKVLSGRNGKEQGTGTAYDRYGSKVPMFWDLGLPEK